MRTVWTVIAISTAFGLCLAAAVCSAAAGPPEDRVTHLLPS